MSESGDVHEGVIPPNACAEILPVKRKKAKRARAVPASSERAAASRARARPRAVPCRSPRRHGRTWFLLVVAIIVITAVPALADDTEPLLVSTFPADQGSERSSEVVKVTATYDRDINGFTSNMKVFDKDGAELDGIVDLAGPQSATGGKRTIRFTPIGSLSEAKSPYEARAKVFALAGGDPAFDVWDFEIDDTPPPAPLITDPVTGQVRDDQPVLAVGTAEAGAFIDIVENTATIVTDRATIGGDFAVVLPYPDEDGVSHTISAVAIDRAGNRSVASADVTFVHDSIEVIPVIETPLEGEHLNAASVVVSGTAKAGATVTIREAGAPVGSTPVDAQGEWSTTVWFAEGTHVITAEAFDGINVDGPSDARTFTADFTPPPVPVIGVPGASATLPSHQVTVAGTAEPNTSVRIREGALLRATLPVDGAGDWDGVITFSEGSHTIKATGRDRAGNLSPASAPRTFTVDTAAPAQPIISLPAEDAFLATNNVTVGGSTEPGASVRVLEGTVLRGVATADGGGAWSVVITFPDGAHSIHAIAVDAAGNASPSSALRGFTVDTRAPDAPTITHPANGDTMFDTDVFVAGSGEPGTIVEVLEGATVVGAAVPDGASNWSLTISFPAGAHTIRARATDLSGNVSIDSGVVSFTVSTGTDITPPPAPTITLPAPGAVVGPTVVFRGSGELGATIEVFEGASELGSGTVNGGGIWEFAAILSAGSHTVTATATDAAGNVSGPSAPRTFTVDATRPTVVFTTASPSVFLRPLQPVVLDGVASDGLGVTGVVVEVWNDLTGARATTVTAACSGCPGTSITWQATLVLGPGIYSARAYATDIAGNRSIPAEIRLVVL